MNKVFKLLVINPGSTSTKIAIFENGQQVMSHSLTHSSEELAPFGGIVDQFDFRKELILQAIEEKGFDVKALDAVVGRGGILRPMASGTYQVSEKMLNDLTNRERAAHASNLGGIIADAIAKSTGIPAMIVDPVVVDEMNPLARYTGLPEMKRISQFHALNQKAVARRAAAELERPYEEVNLIVAHLGGGISVGAHEKGRIVDVNNALDGDGAFSPERAGGLPVCAVVEMCTSGQYTMEQIKKKLVGQGGLVAYLGTNDGREVGKRIAAGDVQAKEVYEAMAYQVAKDIAASAAVLRGKVDAVCITGGLAYDEMLVGWIRERVAFIADVKVYPGEDEMSALAQGGLRVLTGEEKVKEY